jgi:hypothetical protein
MEMKLLKSSKTTADTSVNYNKFKNLNSNSN